MLWYILSLICRTQYKLYSIPKNDVIGDSLSLGLPLLNLSDHDFFELTRFSDSWFPKNDHFKGLVMMVFHFFSLDYAVF